MARRLPLKRVKNGGEETEQARRDSEGVRVEVGPPDEVWPRAGCWKKKALLAAEDPRVGKAGRRPHQI